jgi:hypothetical protein
VQHVDGVVLLRRLESAAQYELARAELPESKPAKEQQSQEPSRAGATWRRCAVYLEPSIPKPQVRGVVVEFGQDEPTESLGDNVDAQSLDGDAG